MSGSDRSDWGVAAGSIADWTAAERGFAIALTQATVARTRASSAVAVKIRRKLAAYGVTLKFDAARSAYALGAADRARLKRLVGGPPAAPAAAPPAPLSPPPLPVPRSQPRARFGLAAAELAAVERLRAKGWSVTSIARHLGLAPAAIAAHFGIEGGW